MYGDPSASTLRRLSPGRRLHQSGAADEYRSVRFCRFPSRSLSRNLERDYSTVLRAASISRRRESLFLDHVRVSLIELGDGIQAVRSQDGIVRGRLHLGILQSLGPYLQLPQLLQRFRSSFPQIEFAVRAMSNDRIPADVRSGSVDLSFYAVIGKAEWPGVRVIPYAQDSLVAICSRNHRFASSKSVRLEVLSRESFVDLTADRAVRKLVDHGFAQYHLKRSTVFEMSDIETALQFVGAGLGVAVGPSALVRSSADLRQIHDLQSVDRKPRLPKWRIAILTRARQKNLEGKSTVELFLETLADLPRPILS